MGALVTGDPEHDDTFCGAVNSKQHYEKVGIEFINGLVFQINHSPWCISTKDLLQASNLGGRISTAGQGRGGNPAHRDQATCAVREMQVGEKLQKILLCDLLHECYNMIARGGYFIQPTLISGLPDSSRCMQVDIADQ